MSYSNLVAYGQVLGSYYDSLASKICFSKVDYLFANEGIALLQNPKYLLCDSHRRTAKSSIQNSYLTKALQALSYPINYIVQ